MSKAPVIGSVFKAVGLGGGGGGGDGGAAAAEARRKAEEKAAADREAKAKADAEARQAAEHAKGLATRESMLLQQARAGGATRSENEADVLQYRPASVKRRSASRTLLG